MKTNKTREVINHHMDSKIWNDFTYRQEDIVIGSYIKSGTTWLQQIVGQLIFKGEEGLPIARISPWLEQRILKDERLAALEKQEHRRFVKTHLPADAIVFSEKAKYLYIARDGRDVVWSMHPHYAKANDFLYQKLNEIPGDYPPFTRPPESIRQYFNEWLEKDGYPIWSFWENISSWWNIRDEPNVRLLHYNNLKKDLAAETRKIAGFLEIGVDDKKWQAILKHCSFDYMKLHADKSVPFEGKLWDGGAKTFFYKGTNKRWVDELTSEESQRYEKTAIEKLGEECAYWLATGELEKIIK